MSLLTAGGRRLRVGTFIKTPSPHIVEILAHAGLDFAIVDAEHGPFDRSTVDIMMLASRAANLPLFVRLPDDRAATILWALDLGAIGIVIPHVDSADQARDVVRAAKYLIGERGYSNGPRAAGYGTRSTDTIVHDGNATEIICQIESVSAVNEVEAISAVGGVDAIMIGRADLAFSLGTIDAAAPAVLAATRRSLAAARGAGIGGAIVTGSADELETFARDGATIAIVGTDQSFLRKAVTETVAAARTILLHATADVPGEQA